jgi:hypothetical protein
MGVAIGPEAGALLTAPSTRPLTYFHTPPAGSAPGRASAGTAARCLTPAPAGGSPGPCAGCPGPGTARCATPATDQQARGGVSVRMVASVNSTTVRARPPSPCRNPLRLAPVRGAPRRGEARRLPAVAQAAQGAADGSRGGRQPLPPQVLSQQADRPGRVAVAVPQRVGRQGVAQQPLGLAPGASGAAAARGVAQAPAGGEVAAPQSSGPRVDGVAGDPVAPRDGVGGLAAVQVEQGCRSGPSGNNQAERPWPTAARYICWAASRRSWLLLWPR